MKKGLRLGVDLGGTFVKLALVDQNGRCLEVENVESGGSPQRLARRLAQAAAPWFQRRLLGTGIGVAGDVDPHKGVVRFAPNLKWKNVPIRDHFRRAGFPEPVHVENDATAAGWGVFHSELKGRARNLVVLTLGTGVGGGLVFEQRLYRGATGSAGEIGHMVIDPQGPLCGCGNRGCLEAYLGGIHLVKRAATWLRRHGRKPPPDLSPLYLHQRAMAGDRWALALWKEAGEAFGTGLANLINLLNPDRIILTGGVAGSAALLLKFARPRLLRAFQTPRRAARIAVSNENKHIGVIGAALLVE